VRSKLEELPVEITTDAAGNVWADLPGEQEGFVIVGSHVDSVPAGGWLDGALGLFAALEVLRAHADEKPPVGLRFVDWADEEGARFGRSLFGSSACAGTLEIDEVLAKTKDESLKAEGLFVKLQLNARKNQGDIAALAPDIEQFAKLAPKDPRTSMLLNALASSTKDEGKKAGEAAKEAGKETGKAAKHVGKATAKATKKGAKAVKRTVTGETAAICKDGTTQTGKTKTTACVDHGGARD